MVGWPLLQFLRFSGLLELGSAHELANRPSLPNGGNQTFASLIMSVRRTRQVERDKRTA